MKNHPSKGIWAGSLLRTISFTLFICFFNAPFAHAGWTYPFGNQVKIMGEVTRGSYPYHSYDYSFEKDLVYIAQAGSPVTAIFAVEVEIYMPAQHTYYAFQPIVEGTYFQHDPNFQIVVSSDRYGQIEVECGVSISIPASEPNCDVYTIRYRLTSSNYPGLSSDWAEIKLMKQEHLMPILTRDQRLLVNDALATPDVMSKDNRNDGGFEPFDPLHWNHDYKEITQSQDLYNNNFGMKEIFENPMHSQAATPNYNTIGVKVRNRSCKTTDAAQLKMYWTIARLWEPWATDWTNYQRAPYAASNKILDKDNIERPLGNEITISDIYKYESAESPMAVVPLGPGESKTYFYNWIVPNPQWYLGASTLPIQVKATGEPVICLLARIEETSRTQNGFYFNPLPSAATNIVDYTSKNNNVVTRNTYILSSKNGYKRKPADDDAAGQPGSGTGAIIVNNPEELPVISIGIIHDKPEIPADGEPQPAAPVFTDNGYLTIYLDALLWERWVNGGMMGHNIQVMEEQVIRVTDKDYARLDNISISSQEMGFMAINASFYEDALPEADYDYHFAVGAINTAYDGEEGAHSFMGSPSHFVTTVLDSVAYEKTDTLVQKSMVLATGNTDKGICIYPNPACDHIYVTNIDVKDVSGIYLYGADGRLVKYFTVNNAIEQNRLALNVADLSSGVYYLIAGKGSSVISKKVVINR